MNTEALSCDYVIAGAGSAGCVLANRLSESPEVSVVLLEAGGTDRSPLIAMPMGESHLIGGRYDWSFETEPEERLDGYRFTMPRGRVLGGSSSINGQVYSRGHPRDYDEWRQLGCEGWSWDDVLPCFRRAESWEEGGDRHRGGDGPLQTTRGRFEHPLYDAFLRAGASLGYGYTPDYNGAQPEGFTRVQYTHTHRTLRRCSSAYAYLRPARRRPNLRVITGAHATRVLLEGDRATGIEYLSGGERRQVRAKREVLVCAGAYQSPQLLLLSGIGPPDELRGLGVVPRHPLPGVGRNLQDHFGSFLQHECRQPVTFYRYRNPLRFAGALAEYFLFRRGPLTVFPMDAVAHLRSDPALERPDLQVYLCPMRVNPIREGSLWPREHGFNLHWNLLRPESRGRVSLRSADPLAPPRIWHNYLATEGDRRLNCRALDICREIMADEAFAPFRGRGDRAGGGLRDACGHRRLHDSHAQQRIPPGRHLSHGRGRGCGRRPPPAGARPLRIAGGGRLGHAEARRRQHQRAHHHDRREGGGAHQGKQLGLSPGDENVVLHLRRLRPVAAFRALQSESAMVRIQHHETPCRSAVTDRNPGPASLPTAERRPPGRRIDAQ